MSPAMADAPGWRGTDEGKKLKSATSWDGTDDYGFSALPAGYRLTDGSFGSFGSPTLFWTATENDASYAWSRFLSSGLDDVGRYNGNKDLGFSVRCLQD